MKLVFKLVLVLTFTSCFAVVVNAQDEAPPVSCVGEIGIFTTPNRDNIKTDVLYKGAQLLLYVTKNKVEIVGFSPQEAAGPAGQASYQYRGYKEGCHQQRSEIQKYVKTKFPKYNVSWVK